MSISQIMAEKNKSMEVSIKTNPENVFSAVDSFYATTENSNLLNTFNNSYAKKIGAVYAPEGSKVKFVGDCIECRTFTDYIIYACNNYGCVADKFVSTIASDNCANFIYTSTKRVTATLDLLNLANPQNASATQDNQCYTVPMLEIPTFITVLKKAMCGCLAINAMDLATRQLVDTITLTIDRAILYGSYDAIASTPTAPVYATIPTFESIDKVKTTTTLTASTVEDAYTKIVDAVSSILLSSGCSTSEAKILMSPAVKNKFNGIKDNNGRLMMSEIRNGDTCDYLINCNEVIECNSVSEYVNGTGKLVSDIWIGIPRHYAFGKYILPEVSQPFVDQQTFNYKIPAVYYIGGKLDQTKSFIKLTVTL